MTNNPNTYGNTNNPNDPNLNQPRQANAGNTGTSTGSTLMTGMFRSRDDAEKAYNSLSSRGYTDRDVNVLMSDETRKRNFEKTGTTAGKETELGNKALKGAGIGGLVGTVVGATAGAIAAVGTAILIPGLGLVIAGPIAGALAGAGAGGATGGLVGLLAGSGVPEERVKKYDEGIKKGGIVIGFRPKNQDDVKAIENEWKSCRGEDICC